MGSGLIYAALIAAWGAYFIPRWLRRHEELSEAKSVEKFDQAMRVLSGQTPVGDQRYLVMPPRWEDAAAPRGADQSVHRPRTQQRPARVSPVTLRRRRVLAALLLTTLSVSGLVPVTPLPWESLLVLLAGTLAFLAHCRLQVRVSTDVSRTRDAVRRRSLSRLMRFDAIERLMSVRREMAADRAAEEQRWADAEEADRQVREAEAAEAERAAGGWQPVPVPLPTYVSKPMAPRRMAAEAPSGVVRPRTSAEAIESAPFDQTQHHPAAVPQQQAHQPGRPAPMSALLDDADEADGQLEAILRRAVND